MNTTGNPGGGEPGPGAEPVGDYGYSGGYGYGPGYGDLDGGGAYSYGQTGHADPGQAAGTSGTGANGAGANGAASNEADANDGGADAAARPAGTELPPMPPVVADTPALKGYPGGAGLERAADGPAGPAGREARGLNSPSVWQNAQRTWRDSGVEWQRPVADGEPAETEWEQVQAAPPGKRRGLPGKAAWSGGTAAGKPSSRRTARSLTRSPSGLLQRADSAVDPQGSGTTQGSQGTTAGLQGAAVTPAATTPGTSVTPAATTPGASVTPPATAPGISLKPPGGGARHVRRGVWLAAVAVIVVLVLVVVGLLVFGGNGGGPAGSGALGSYPPARLAGADFTAGPGQQVRGIFQSVSGVAASGSTIVAVGSQAGQWVPRAQFFVSADSGRSWQLATVRGPGGAVPSPAALPLLVAGGAPLPAGRGGWLALGTGAAWTSPDGKTWTLAAGAGITPLQASDRVLALARTASGFLAVGENVPGGNQASSSPVAWTSANGLNWQRLPADRLHLAAPGGHVLQLTRVSAHGSHVIVEGAVASTRGSGKHRTTSLSDGLWLSVNAGSSWVPAHVPVGSGAVSHIDGVAATGSGFVAIRPGSTKQTGSDAVAYVSSDGSSWSRAATITAAKTDHLQVTGVGGSDQGAVVSGQLASGARVAYVSTNGTSWRRAAGLGSSAQSLAGVTVTAGGTVVAAGTTVRSAEGQQPYLVLAGSQARTVNFGAIPGATGPALGISGIAVAGGTQVAVGTANGYTAIWSAGRSGRWKRASSAALTRPGLGTLASVVHGRPGWLAVGEVATGAPSRPVVVVSSSGTSWQAADGETAFAGPGIAVNQAAAGRSVYVIVGRQVIPARTVTKTTVVRRRKHVTSQVIPSQAVAAAWWSAGLTGWTRGAGATAGDLAGPGSPQMVAVTAAGTGFVAVGSARNAPAVWTSLDGKRWELTGLRSPDGSSTALLQHVAAQRNLIVATGTETTATGTAPFAAYSTDGGTSWQEASLRAPGGFAAVTALTAAGRGFEAVGTVGPPGNQHVVVWSSRNGLTWRAREPAGTGLSGRGSQALTALTASGSLLTGAGYAATPLSEQPTLWKAVAASG